MDYAIDGAIRSALAITEKKIAEMKARHGDKFSALGDHAEKRIQACHMTCWHLRRHS